MPVSYDKNKIHIYNWVENNRDKLYAIQKNYYTRNAEKKKGQYQYKKEALRLRNIFIDDLEIL